MAPGEGGPRFAAVRGDRDVGEIEPPFDVEPEAVVEGGALNAGEVEFAREGGVDAVAAAGPPEGAASLSLSGDDGGGGVALEREGRRLGEVLRVQLQVVDPEGLHAAVAAAWPVDGGGGGGREILVLMAVRPLRQVELVRHRPVHNQLLERARLVRGGEECLDAVDTVRRLGHERGGRAAGLVQQVRDEEAARPVVGAALLQVERPAREGDVRVVQEVAVERRTGPH